MLEVQFFSGGAVTVVDGAERSASAASITGPIVRSAGNETTVTLAEANEAIPAKLLLFENEDRSVAPAPAPSCLRLTGC